MPLMTSAALRPEVLRQSYGAAGRFSSQRSVHPYRGLTQAQPLLQLLEGFRTQRGMSKPMRLIAVDFRYDDVMNGDRMMSVFCCY